MGAVAHEEALEAVLVAGLGVDGVADRKGELSKGA